MKCDKCGKQMKLKQKIGNVHVHMEEYVCTCGNEKTIRVVY